MAKTGIKFKGANVGSVEAHNERSKEYLEALERAGMEMYFFPELTPNNQSWVNSRYEGKTCEELFKDMKSLYKQKTGQEPQLKDREITYKKTGKKKKISGWSPIREGCPPVKEDTKIEDFAPFVDWLRSNGLDVIRIDLHQDEGHVDWEKEMAERKNGIKAKKYISVKGVDGKLEKVNVENISFNRHAHVVVDWIDHNTGKTLKLDETKMSEAQDVLASALGMERGDKKSVTGKQHIPHAEYREMKAAESAAAMEKKAEEAKMERDKAVEEQRNLREETLILSSQKQSIESDIKSLESSISLKAEGVVKGTAQGIVDLMTRKSKKRADKAEEESRKYKAVANAKVKEAKEAIEKALEVESKANKRISEVDAWQRSHKAELSQIETYKQRTADKENELLNFKSNVKGLIEGSASIGLSVNQILRLYQGQEIILPCIYLQEHSNIPIETKNKTPWRLRFKEKFQILQDNVWRPFSEWIKDARRGVMEIVRKQNMPSRGKGRGI